MTKLLLVTTTTLLASACGSISPPQTEKVAADCQVVKHDLGETKICGEPQRVVALDPHMLDLMLSLGVQPVGYAEVDIALVGKPQLSQPLTQIKYLGDRITNNPVYIGTRSQPSLEAIVRLKPDLILGELNNRSLYAKLSQIAPTLFPFQDFDNYQWQQTLIKLGQVFQREQLAKQAIAQHDQRIAKAKAELEPITTKSPVLLLVMADLGNIGVFTNETFAGALLQDIGFELLIPQQLSGNVDEIPVSLETLPQLDAEMIIVMITGHSGVETVKRDWEQNQILRSLKASQAGQVYFVDYQLWSRIRGPIAAELMINQLRQLLLER